MTTSPTDLGPVRTPDDLHALWSRLARTVPAAGRSLWLVPLDHHGSGGLVVPVDDLPAEPGDLSPGLGVLVDHLIRMEGVAAVVAAVRRPGSLDMAEPDRRWARALHEQTRLTERWPLHLVTDDAVRVFAPDDLLTAV